ALGGGVLVGGGRGRLRGLLGGGLRPAGSRARRARVRPDRARLHVADADDRPLLLLLHALHHAALPVQRGLLPGLEARVGRLHRLVLAALPRRGADARADPDRRPRLGRGACAVADPLLGACLSAGDQPHAPAPRDLVTVCYLVSSTTSERCSIRGPVHASPSGVSGSPGALSWTASMPARFAPGSSSFAPSPTNRQSPGSTSSCSHAIS